MPSIEYGYFSLTLWSQLPQMCHCSVPLNQQFWMQWLPAEHWDQIVLPQCLAQIPQSHLMDSVELYVDQAKGELQECQLCPNLTLLRTQASPLMQMMKPLFAVQYRYQQILDYCPKMSQDLTLTCILEHIKHPIQAILYSIEQDITTLNILAWNLWQDHSCWWRREWSCKIEKTKNLGRLEYCLWTKLYLQQI